MTVVTTDQDDDVFLIGEDNYLNVVYDDCSWIVDLVLTSTLAQMKDFSQPIRVVTLVR